MSVVGHPGIPNDFAGLARPSSRGHEFTDRCPACGYYLSAADRRRLFAGDSKPKWVLITAGIVLIVLLLGVLTLRF